MLALLQSAADSTLATTIGTTLGNQLTVFVLAGLGLLTKLITSLVGKFMPQWWDTQSDAVKAIVALVFSQVVVFLNWKFGISVSPDVTALGTSLAGVATWLIAMGWHRLAKFLPINQPTN